MIDTWHNNRISEKLNTNFPKDFSICDIDGAVRCEYNLDGIWKKRFIIYESKNENEKKMGDSQKKTLKLINDSIDWSKFDSYSGLYILKILNIEDKILWFNINQELVRTTNFKELYNIFSCKKF